MTTRVELLYWLIVKAWQYYDNFTSACLIVSTNYKRHAGIAIQTRHDIELGLALSATWKIFHSKRGLTTYARLDSKPDNNDLYFVHQQTCLFRKCKILEYLTEVAVFLLHIITLFAMRLIQSSLKL